MKQKSLRIPRPIKPGDTIGVVAPSFPISPEEKEKTVELLTGAGFQVKLGKTIEQNLNFHNYLAGDARLRADDVNRMFADSEIDGILCARGGYGSSQVMPYLDLGLIRKYPKVFIGYSDITNFHSVLNKYCDLVTYHGPMAVSNMKAYFDEYTKNSLIAAMNINRTQDYLFQNPAEQPMWTVVPGCAEGILTGGNLSLLQRSVGTFYEIETQGKILFLEDVEESIPAIDMMITHLEQAGLMKGIHGLLLGNFAACSNKRYDGSYSLEAFIRDRFSDYSVPVIANVCSGHEKPMGTLPMGAVCRMDGKACSIVFSVT